MAKREVRLLRHFDHPNNTKLYQMLDNAEDTFIVM